MKKIKVEVSPNDSQGDVFVSRVAYAQYETEKALHEASTTQLIDELFNRGVSYRDIWGGYYEREVAGESRLLTVEDARLAGHQLEIEEGETF